MTPRRRSALLGVSALSLAIGAAGCERQSAQEQALAAGEQTMPVYASKAECATEWDEAGCEAAFQKASAEHAATAPKYASRAECEAAVGPEACQEQRTAGGGSFFMPLMMGMMMGQMMNNRRGYPVYADRSGAAYTGTTRVADPNPARQGFGGAAGGAGALPRTVTAPVTPSGAIASPGATQRGGFGRTAAYRGSAGA